MAVCNKPLRRLAHVELHATPVEQTWHVSPMPILYAGVIPG